MALPRKVKLTKVQENALVEGRVAFMKFCPFYCHYFYEQMVEYPTDQIKTFATDGRRIYVNPAYAQALKPMERAFAYAHEVEHVIKRHPQRAAHYARQKEVVGLPYNATLMNVAMDLPINAHLIDMEVGMCNPSWLYDKDIGADELSEDVYAKLYKRLPPPPPPPPPSDEECEDGEGGTGEGGQPGDSDDPTNGSDPPDPTNTPPNTPRRGDTKKGGRPDPQADAENGRFDEVLPPQQDPATGKEDLPTEQEFVEAVARAAAAAKAAGNFPASLQRQVAEITEPQVNWRDHLRIKLAGKLGQSRTTWESPNRRRIVLNPAIYLPGRRGYGAELVVVVIDNSGSIGEPELSTFFGETGAILADCRPKKVMVIWCDAKVHRVEEARNLDELAHIRVEGSTGGGGTSFRPPFNYLAERDIRPDTTVYLTDMYPGDGWPDEPNHPVIWCATSDVQGPWGETVHIEVGG